MNRGLITAMGACLALAACARAPASPAEALVPSPDSRVEPEVAVPFPRAQDRRIQLPTEPGHRPRSMVIRERDVESKLQATAEASGCLSSLDPIELDVAIVIEARGRVSTTEIVPGALPAGTMHCLEASWVDLPVLRPLPEAMTIPLRIAVKARNQADHTARKLEQAASSEIRTVGHRGQRKCQDIAREDGWLDEGGTVTIGFRLDSSGRGVAEATVERDDTGWPGLADCVRSAVLALRDIGSPELGGVEGAATWSLTGRTLGIREHEREERIADGRIEARECGRHLSKQVPVVVLLHVDDGGGAQRLEVELDRRDAALERCIRVAFQQVGSFGADLPKDHRITFLTFAKDTKEKLTLGGKREEPKDSEEDRRARAERAERAKQEEERRKKLTPEQKKQEKKKQRMRDGGGEF